MPFPAFSSARRAHRSAALAGAVLVSCARFAAGVNSSTPSHLNGLDINTFLGADRFYDDGYTGSRSIVANIEGGWVWNGQESLTNASTTFADPSITGQYDKHATWVGSAIAGRETAGGGDYQKGIAYGATLWSGAVAQSWVNPGAGNYALNFNFDVTGFHGAYTQAMETGINGTTADVVNSSWSTAPGANGNSIYSRTLDALAYDTGKTIVLSSGNTGASNGVTAPASGMNGIVVASLGSDTSVPPYSTVSTFSSRSPSDEFIPFTASGSSGINLSSVRAAVDIAAPGENLSLAEYDGPTGGNSFGGASGLATNQYTDGLNGTSFAAPLVAGGAALLVDAGKAMYSTNSKAIDGRVIKAVLMNSADKTIGWSNGQTMSAHVLTTTQSVDYTVGAGRMNLSKAFDQYTTGTDDVAGLSAGAVADIGWDYGRVTSGTPQDYTLAGILSQGSTINATLDWFADDTVADDGYGSFDNLDLQIWTTDALGSAQTLVAQSISPYNSVQELSFNLPQTSQYLMRVYWAGNSWNLNNEPPADDYALAWNVTAVPEPGMGILPVLLVMLFAVYRPRRTS